MMFNPRVPKAAMYYLADTAMPQGTAVKQGNDGFLDVAANGTGAIGFLAVEVRDYNSRTESEILFPDFSFGWLLAPEFINQPGVADPKHVGVRIGAGYEYEVMINASLAVNDELVADANGLLEKKPVGDGRTTLAVVIGKGTGVGLPLDAALNPALRTWMIRTLI